MSTAVPLHPFCRVRVASIVRDYAELTKVRVTMLIVMTAGCGYYFAAHQGGRPSFT